ncbi:MAG: alpha/beta fold hydrolase [Candidatus Competibacteraceae bacterium]|jgi:pimeloyl-ACP methyl ester carboxylesterase|nr:alpha/beta fold hydrolase [Candidatus Competibacteraceae bacterium]
MLARLLLKGLAIEVLLYGIGGWLLWRYAGYSPGILIVLAVVTLLGIRLVSVGILCAIGWIYRAERPVERRIGLWQSVRLFGAEWLSMLALYLFFQPLGPWLTRTGRHSADHSTATPILLIHGYTCNAGFWWALERFLRKRGLNNLFTITLEPVFGDIDDYARQVAERVENLCKATGAEHIILVGHSMGGLVARAYLHRYGERNRVAGIISLGSPHHGSLHARFALVQARNVEQMSPNNAWLAELNADEDRNAPVPMVSIYSDHDELVTPQTSARLRYTNSRNISVMGVGHLAMAFEPSLHTVVFEQLSEVLNNSDELPEDQC